MKKASLILAAALVASAVSAQKPKVTNAENSLLLQRYDDAKTNIDEALANEKSNTWPKTYAVAADVYSTLDAQGKLDGGLAKAKEYLLKAEELDQAGDGNGKNVGKYTKDITKVLTKFSNNATNVGVNSFNNRNYNGAKDAFVAVIWANKKVAGDAYQEVTDSVFYLNAALAGMQAEDYSFAAEYFDKCIDIDYDGEMSTLRANYCYQQLSDTTNIERILQKGFMKYPDNKDILITLIQHYLTAQKYDDALVYLNQAIEKDPSNAMFFYARGCLNEKVNIESAISDYEKAIELNPNLFNALYNLGVVYFNRGIEIVNEASGERDNTKYNKLVEASKVEFQKSAPYFERAAENADNDENKKYVYEQLKSIYYRLGDYDKSSEYSKKAQEI